MLLEQWPERFGGYWLAEMRVKLGLGAVLEQGYVPLADELTDRDVLRQPFIARPGFALYENGAPQGSAPFVTFCGT